MRSYSYVAEVFLALNEKLSLVNKELFHCKVPHLCYNIKVWSSSPETVIFNNTVRLHVTMDEK